VGPHHTQVHGSSGQNAPEVHRLGFPRFGQTQGHVDFGPYLVAGPADGRAQVNQQILRTRSEIFGEDGNSRLQYSRYDAPPPRVEGGHRAAVRVHHEHRNAVRHRDGHERTGPGGDVTVGVGSHGETGNRSLQEEDPIPVNLTCVGDPREAL